jgi:hypothetical protein
MIPEVGKIYYRRGKSGRALVVRVVSVSEWVEYEVVDGPGGPCLSAGDGTTAWQGRGVRVKLSLEWEAAAMKFGLVELYVDLHGIREASQTNAVLRGIRRHPDRANAVRRALGRTADKFPKRPREY